MNSKKRAAAIFLIIALWCYTIAGQAFFITLFPQLYNNLYANIGSIVNLLIVANISFIIWKYFKNRKGKSNG